MLALLIAAALAAPGSAGEAHGAVIQIGGIAGVCFTYARAGRTDAIAIERCTLALIRDPLNARDRAATLVNRGAIYLKRRENTLAMADFDEAVKTYPKLGEAHVGRGGVLVAEEQWAEAEAEITHGLDLGVEQPEKAYYFRALARWGQENIRGAYFDFRKAQELAPKWKDPADQLAFFQVTPVQAAPAR